MRWTCNSCNFSNGPLTARCEQCRKWSYEMNTNDDHHAMMNGPRIAQSLGLNPSDTPRTDAATIPCGWDTTNPVVKKEFAQGLEREITGLRVALAAMGAIAESNAAQEQAVRLANQIDKALALVNEECPAMDEFKNIVPTVEWLIQKWRECRKMWSASSQELSRIKVRVSELQDALDLDDENFGYIHALACGGVVGMKLAAQEVQEICDRARIRNWQLVPLIEQLESAKKENQRIRDEFSALLYTAERNVDLIISVSDRYDLDVAIESAKEALK